MNVEAMFAEAKREYEALKPRSHRRVLVGRKMIELKVAILRAQDRQMKRAAKRK